MSVRRFVGANSRDVMRQVRESLGEDALIVANRRTEGGVEILAMADEAIDHFEPSPEPALSETPVAAVSQDPMQVVSERLLREMQEMRELLVSSQPPSTAVQPQSPPIGANARLRQLLCSVGFSSELSEEVLAGLPKQLSGINADSEETLQWLKQQLIERLCVLSEEASFFDKTGIVALVGPTGVGKTTTTAKLAARFVMRHGTRPVALVSTDSFRIGAHEQLRIYARLLDTPMYALDAEQPIDDLLGRLQGKQWVIIDTVGMSQRDQRVIEQIAHLQGGRSQVRLVLLLNAASQPETLEEVVLRYRQAARAAGAELDDCIITKQDEAGRLGPVLDIIMRHGMRVLFGSNGQQVPEDMAIAVPETLIDQALKTSAPHREREHFDAPMGMPRWSRDVLGQGRRLSSLLARLRERVTGFMALEETWNLASLPSRVQGARLDALLATYPASDTTLGMTWSPRRNERGCDWSMPDIGLDINGAWLALPWLQHRHTAGWQPRLAALTAASGVAVHLLPRLPENDAMAWLEAERLTWVSQASPSYRVFFHHERQTLRQLFTDSVLTHHVGVRFRGQNMQLWTAYAEVKDATGLALLAWYGEVRDPESTKVIARRYWLTPVRLGAEVLSLLLTQLQSEGLAGLTRRAWQQLKEADSGDLNAEVRLLMASGVASVAGHLDVADDEEAQTLRGDLLNLLGASRRRRDTAMLDALVYAFMARDAIRQLGSISREGVA